MRPFPLVLLAVVTALATPPSASAAERDTTFALPGLSAPVTLATDPYGIPHLLAANRADLYFAWGFVTARDRLWQIEHSRRAARGRLWEWFGNRTLRADGGAQLFELAERAARIWERDRRDAATRRALEGFAAGVNAYLALCRSGSRPWPAEFHTLGRRPEDWRPEDSVLILLAQGVLLDLVIPELAEAETIAVRGAGWFERRRRHETDHVFSSIPDSVAARMFGRPSRPRLPGAPFPGGTGIGWKSDGVPVERDPEQGASNGFAVGPRRSASGKPILANDVHLSLSAPGPLYALHVTVPDSIDAVGAGAPGLPIIASGRNHTAAWGVTSLGADVLDVYADTLSADGRSVRWEGRWQRMREADYQLRFRWLGVPLPALGQKRRYTPHGPVVAIDRKRRVALSVRWTALEGQPSLRDLLGLEAAPDVPEIARRFRTLVTPTFNLVAADTEGRVRYQSAGAVPRRRFDPGYGVLPGDGRHEWSGVIPPDSMPAWDVPPDGFVVNGNNLPIGSPYPEALPRFDWIHDRAARLSQRLAGDPQLSLSDARSVQNDVYSRAAERFVPRLLACADSAAATLSDSGRAALDTLRGWDYVCVRDRVAPTLFRAWLGTYLRRSALGDVPSLAAAALDGRAPGTLVDPATRLPERPSRAAALALEEALAALRALLGPDSRYWTWSHAHRARFVHALAWRDPSFNPPSLGVDGDNGTPAVAPSRLPRDVHVMFGPVWRHVVDLAVRDSSLAALPPGNAGGPEHRLDHLQRWANHRYVPLYLDWDRVRAVRESEWRLEPGPSRR